jgi:hypothetical protein
MPSGITDIVARISIRGYNGLATLSVPLGTIHLIKWDKF